MESTDQSLTEVLFRQASVNLCSNTVGQILVYLMVTPPPEESVAGKLHKAEVKSVLNDLEEKALIIKQSFKEISSSRTKIIEKLNCEVDTFCYPAGKLNDIIIDKVKEAGYKYGVVTPPVKNIPNSLFTLRRVGVYRYTSMIKFKLKTRSLIQHLIEKSKKGRYRH